MRSCKQLFLVHADAVHSWFRIDSSLACLDTWLFEMLGLKMSSEGWLGFAGLVYLAGEEYV